MKKFMFAAVAVLALASCKKDYTCECTDMPSYAIENSSKKDAEAQCEGKVGNGLVSVNVNTGCALK